MTTWIWSKADHRGLARFVHMDAAWQAAALDLGIDRLAEEAKPGGRRTIVECIYQKLRWRHPRIDYDREEFLRHGDYRQPIRTPRTILNTDRRGTCLDLSLLFCALCLKNNLLPFVINVEGHAFAAVLLTHSRKSQGVDAWDAFGRFGFDIVKDREGEIIASDVLLSWIDQGILLPVECTGFAYSEALPDSFPEGQGRKAGFFDFERAVAAGRQQLEASRRPFHYAIDVQFLQDELGFEADSPPDWSPASVQPARRKVIIPSEYLGWLTSRVLQHTGFLTNTTRDQLVADVRSYLNTDVRLRSDEPRTDVHFILATIFQHDDGQACFETLLPCYVTENTLLGHLIDYARDLASLADLRPLLSHVDLSLGEMRSNYTASVRDPQRAHYVGTVEEALHDLLDLPPGRKEGWSPICEFVERVARLCRNDALHRWVDGHEADPVKKTELRAALDSEKAAPPMEYIVIDVSSPKPEALEYWRFDCNNVPRCHGFQPCTVTASPLEDTLAKLVDCAADWSTDARFEVFLPYAMLANDIDQWPCETFEGKCRLGERHAASIRWRERARNGRRRPQWKAFASRLQQGRPTRSALSWLEQARHGGSKLIEEVTSGACGDCLAFPFIPFEPDMRAPNGHLRCALGGGMMYGIWLRRSPVDWQAFRNNLRTLFEGGVLEELPVRIRDARRDACDESDPQHPFRNLTLFWDEPRRNPWEQGELTEPGQKSTPNGHDRLEDLYRRSDTP